MGKFEQAEKYLLRCVELVKREYGEEYFGLATTYWNLASLYDNMEKLY